MDKISVVIPTLQKNKQLLLNLLNILEKDNGVDEIIVIDNSTQGFEYNSEKLKLIVPKTNLYVNPSWNLGVKEAKNEIVALLNDDITVSNTFCSDVAKKMKPDMGSVGFLVDFIEETKEILPEPQPTEIELVKIDGRCMHWGVAIFLYKSSFVPIPDDIKIYYGDDWIILQNQKQKRNNYCISGQKIYHYGSLSSKTKSFNPINENDKRLYRKLTRKWWQFIFNVQPVFRGFRLTFLGIEIVCHNNKKH